MEDKKTILDYLGQALIIFGGMILVILATGRIVGPEASEISTLFSMAGEGIGQATILQILLLSVIITTIRFLFFTDVLIKNMKIAARTICMFLCIILTIVVMVLAFKWFPADNLRAWIGFAVSFALCSGISFLISYLKEKSDNQKLERALQNIQK